MKHTFLYCILLLMITGACTLHPSELYYEEIEMPNPKGYISLNNFDSVDTIYLYNAVAFEFSLGIDQGKLETVQVLLGNSVISTTNSSSGKFSLTMNELRTGTNKLKIQFIANSESGSLANKLGAEKFQLWREWVLVIDVTVPPNPALSLSSENGFLKLSWTGYHKPNFAYYMLEIQYNRGSTKYVMIKNQDRSFWVDSSYVSGYSAQYRVIVTALQSSASPFLYHYDPSELKVSYRAADSTISMSWIKPKFPGAFKQYRVVANGEENLITNINDTTLTYQLKEVVFKKDVQVSFSIKAKYPVFVSSDLTQIITNTAGAPFLKPSLKYIYYNIPSHRIIIGIDANGYVGYYDDTMQQRDSIFVPVQSVNYHSASPYFYYQAQGNMVQLNLLTREAKKSLIPLPSGYRSGPSNFSGAANGVISYSLIYYSNAFYSAERMYNFNTDNLFYNHQSKFISLTNDHFSPPYLSGQGRYTINWASNQIYRLNGTALELIGKLPVTGSFVRFRDDNDDQILIKINGKLSILNTTNPTELRTIISPEGYDYVMYDPGTHYALFAKPNSERMCVINIDTQETQVIKVLTDLSNNATSVGFSYNEYKLVNGFLFAPGGAYLKII